MVHEHWVHGYEVYNPRYTIPVTSREGITTEKSYVKTIKKSTKDCGFRPGMILVVTSTIRPYVLALRLDRVRPHDPETSVSFNQVYPAPTGSISVNASFEAVDDLVTGDSAFEEYEDWDKISDGTPFVDYD
ncbi:hypothetical protein K9N68_37675 (plasmid) [Kovacikia minuta CCNUW1]|uniref:hypothetical protein n=1 Tax=Kovacikia minuta TaxID=2931930 RepID=UPI001CCB84CB|nr:hypothetical protein [Kovacikia minuta]UBF29942.1 hypothetical protein K9N68_37675 [Kovacikia minuta CCNUW1]